MSHQVVLYYIGYIVFGYYLYWSSGSVVADNYIGIATTFTQFFQARPVLASWVVLTGSPRHE